MTRQRNTARAQFSSDLTVREFWELGHAGINNWKRRNRLADLETRPSKDEDLEKLAKQKGMKYKFLSIAMRVAWVSAFCAMRNATVWSQPSKTESCGARCG